MRRSLSSHFRDPIVKLWNRLGVTYVKFALYKQSAEVGYVVFDGTGSDYMSWFSRSRVVDASWPDLMPDNDYNIFSIEGGHLDTERLCYERSFHINHNYGGCDKDLGHVAAVERYGACDWNYHPAYPQFLYSDMSTATKWDRGMF